eukprot:5969496-Amphidinium_carterae.1
METMPVTQDSSSVSTLPIDPPGLDSAAAADDAVAPPPIEANPASVLQDTPATASEGAVAPPLQPPQPPTDDDLPDFDAIDRVDPAE